MESRNRVIAKNRVVAFDSNMLLGIKGCGIDVFREARGIFGGGVKFVVPVQVARELSSLKKRGKKLEAAVKVAQELMERNSVKVRKVRAVNADEALEKMGGKGAVIATNDRRLIRKVKEANGSILFIRKRKLLQLK